MRAHVQLKKLEHFDEAHPLPKYESLGAAGADIRAMLGVGESILIKPGARVLVPTGLAMAVPQGYECQVRPRSGLSFKTGLMVANSPGTIDSDYRGEVKIILANLGDRDEEIKHGDRVAQLVFAKVPQTEFIIVQELDDTLRGSAGFGSTGML